MLRKSFWAASAFIVAACSCTTAIQASDINDELRSKYQDKQVMLRNFYCGQKLKFDPQGNVVSGGSSGAWTLCRDIRIENVKFTDGKIRMDGKRVFLFYDSAQKRFRDIIEIADKKKEKYKALLKMQDVSIEIELPPNADDQIIQTAVDALFYSSQEEFSKAVPSFWRALLSKLELSSNRGSEPDIGINGLPKPVSGQGSSGVHSSAPIGSPVVAQRELTVIADPNVVAQPSTFHVGNGVSAPVPIYHPEPDYSNPARFSFYQGTLTMVVIIGADGKIHSVRLTRCLGMGLDEKAVEKVLTWEFKPALKDGRAVAVEVNVEVSFNLY